MDEIEKIVDDLSGADTIPKLLINTSNKFPNEIAVKINLKGTIIEKTYLQLKNDSILLCGSLINMKISNDHIAMIGELSYEWIVSYFGIIGSRNVVVPIDKDLNFEDTEELINLADVSVLFLDKSKVDLANYIKKHCKAVKLIICFQSVDNFTSLSEFIKIQLTKITKFIDLSPDQTAMIVFTPASSGKMRAVMLSNINICNNVICSSFLIGKDTLKPSECTVPILPTNHMFAITPGLLTLMLYFRVTICIGGGMNNFFKNLKLFKPTILIIVPMIVEGLYKRIWKESKKIRTDGQLKNIIRLSNFLLKLKIDIRKIIFNRALTITGGKLRVIVCGGSFMNSELIDKFKTFGITLLNGYGITECSPVVSCNRVKLLKKDSVGLIAPKPYCNVKIKNNEILVRGSIVMKGYYKDETATVNVFDENWFKTGDLGYIDKDNYLYITGKSKDLIILKDGNNISPVEIENSIEQHPLVNKAFIYTQHKNGADILVAAIYPNFQYVVDNDIVDSKIDIENFIDTLNTKWPRYKRIKMIEIHEEAFDKLELRKIKRY